MDQEKESSKESVSAIGEFAEGGNEKREYEDDDDVPIRKRRKLVEMEVPDEIYAHENVTIYQLHMLLKHVKKVTEKAPEYAQKLLQTNQVGVIFALLACTYTLNI